jgi:hypothetical protein
MSDHVLGTRTVLTGRVTNWPMIWVTVALVIPLFVMAGPSRGDWNDAGFLVPVAVIVLAIVVNVLTLSNLRTTAGPHGLTVHFGVFGWPRFRYGTERIRTVAATRVTASAWSWGIDWTPRRGLRLTLRSGPAVRLELVNGRKVTVSVRDAERVVAVLVAAGCQPAGPTSAP